MSSDSPDENAGRQTRRKPRQERSRVMVDAIVEATWRVLAEDGYSAASTNRIAARAGVSIGSLYQYFPNKDAIIAEMQRRHHAQMMAIMGAAFAECAGLPLEQATRRLIRAAIDAHLADPEAHRVLAEVVPATVNTRTREDLRDAINAQTIAWLRARREEIQVAELELAAFIIRNLVEVALHEAKVGGAPWQEKPRVIEDELTRIILNYLRR